MHPLSTAIIGHNSVHGVRALSYRPCNCKLDYLLKQNPLNTRCSSSTTGQPQYASLTHTPTHTYTGKNISLLRMLQNEEMESSKETVIASMLRNAWCNRLLL